MSYIKDELFGWTILDRYTYLACVWLRILIKLIFVKTDAH